MNIAYQTDSLRDYYSNNRNTWDQFYPSERWVFERVLGSANAGQHVLDIGCATGGLAHALSERYPIKKYTGVDINPGVIEFAKHDESHQGKGRSFFCGDVCDPQISSFLREENLEAGAYSDVISLGCADFNIEPMKIISSCWEQVRPGGNFILSLRMTSGAGVNSIEQSYQYISFSSDGANEDEEKANYAVFNFQEAMSIFTSLSPTPSALLGYGYWGAPSIAARTPYEQILFSVFSLRKPAVGESVASMQTELHFPIDLYSHREKQ